jgi:ABC-type Fe3+ transport system permease subunit
MHAMSTLLDLSSSAAGTSAVNTAIAVVGAIVLLAAIVLLVVCVIRRRRSRVVLVNIDLKTSASPPIGGEYGNVQPQLCE